MEASGAPSSSAAKLRGPSRVALAALEAADATTPDDRIWMLARDRSATVRRAVAVSHSAPDDVILELANDPDESVRGSAVIGLHGRPRLHEQLSASPDRWVRAILAHTYASHPGSLSYAVQDTLSRDSFFETRVRIAELTEYADIFDRLSQDDDARVRGSCATNGRIQWRQTETFVRDRSWITRSAVAAQGYPDDEQLTRLASDRSVEVRWSVIARYGSPRSALELLTNDPDPMNRQHALLALDGSLWLPEAVVSIVEKRSMAQHQGFVDAGATR
jgi:hypothetical protein